MRAFIQCDKIYNLPYNPNVFNAYDGLRDMGFECVFFQTYEDLLKLNNEKDENTILHIIIDIRFTGILIHVIISAHAASKHITNIYELNISFTIFILLSFFLIIDTAAIATTIAIT